MAWSNYDDVCRQLHDAGLVLGRSGLEVGSTKPVRCKVEGGDREKRGWYWLHEFTTTDGDLLIVGTYGIWRGNENNTQKIELGKSNPLTAEQRAALKKRLAEDRKRMEHARAKQAAIAAERARKMWARLSTEGQSPYLTAKGFGHVPDDDVRYTEHGTAVIHVHDTAGNFHGLQFLRSAAQAKQSSRPAKEFWPAGLAKKGHYHMIGHDPHWIVLVAEGYATGLSLAAATGYPVAVAFDAGNLLPVAEALRKRWKRSKILICADDDCFTEGNPGVTSASAAAIAVNGAWIKPQFTDEAARRAKYEANGHKLTDFNDLAQLESGATVSAQVAARLSELQWDAPQLRAVSSSTPGGRGSKLKPLQSLDDVLQRFSLVWGSNGGVFDHHEHMLVTDADVRRICIRGDLYKAWTEHPERDIVRLPDVGFDPSESDRSITCNLWAGWPSQPEAGTCDRLLGILRHMCSAERNSAAVYDWTLKWLAYPLQHPGAKMKSTIVVHGPQGTGKNMFFEAVMAIYGEYGDILDQSALQDKHNDCFSRKLFMIADEVIAQKERYDIKNMLKTLITGSKIRINPKHLAAYSEANHVNLVFLSNESMPVVLEEDDRRHCVIHTPEKHPADYYARVQAEIDAGAIPALHHFLLHLDLGGFHPASLPPVTEAKRDLINLAQDSPVEFIDAVSYGDIPGVLDDNDHIRPGLTQDWFDVYRAWCSQTNVKPASLKRFVDAIKKQRGIRSERKRYIVIDECTFAETTLGPHGVLLFDRVPPEGESETGWLGQHVHHLREHVKSMRGGHR